MLQSPVPTLVNVRWGNYVGAVGTYEPELILRQRNQLDVRSHRLVALPDGTVRGIPEKCCGIFLHRPGMKEENLEF